MLMHLNGAPPDLDKMFAAAAEKENYLLMFLLLCLLTLMRMTKKKRKIIQTGRLMLSVVAG